MRTRTSDKWIQPCFKTDFSVQLSLDSGGESHLFQLRSVELSMRNIQVECEKAVVDCFRAQNTYPHICDVLFRLPGDQQAVRIKCHMVTHRRLSQKLFYLALKFVDFEGDSAARLESYLLSRQSSAVSSKASSAGNESQTVVKLPQRLRA